MHLIVAGLSHKTAPVEIREKVNFPEQQLSEALHALSGYPAICEAVILSTCNRTEIYIVATDVDQGKRNIIDFICDYHRVKAKALKSHLYYHEGKAAVHHLFRVIASLDSMVVGEAQILGQVKDAYEIAFEADTTSTIFNRLFRHAISVGKRVRTETDIGESAVSISYAAVELAKKVFETLEGRSVLIIGAGKMSELTLRHLVTSGATHVIVTNRTFERAQKLAKQFKGKAVKFEVFPDYLVVVDIIISSTGAPHFVVTKEQVIEAMHRRRNRPIFFIDIAVPRDVEPEVGNLYNVFLYDIDDLDQVVQSNLADRRRAAEVGEMIIEAEVSDFLAWLSSLDVVPTITSLREKAEAIRQGEIEKYLKKLRNLSETERNIINAMTGAIVNKLLHEPIIRMKDCAAKKDGYQYIESLRYLFDLKETKANGKKK
jgi:glutamyl-tRNA reductase